MKNSGPSAEGEDAALDAARVFWEGSEFLRGEGMDEFFRLCFGDSDPLDREFQELSLTIYEPLLMAQQKNRKDR